MHKLKAKEILDSNRRPTLQVELKTDFGGFFASVPSGVSRGKYEALELRDEDGLGVKKAVENIEKIIAPALEKEDLSGQKKIDEILINLDATENKSRLGANAILAVSMVFCRAFATANSLSLYVYVSKLAENSSPLRLPRPAFNMIEGGKHSDSGLAFQEFMVAPQEKSFKENLETGKRIYQTLKEILKKEYEKVSLSKEGAFSAAIKSNSETLDFIVAAVEKAGKKGLVEIAIDAAASEFQEGGDYKLDGKNISKTELLEFYKNLAKKYPIASIEDPFGEEDFEGFSQIKKEIGDKIIVFGDDLTVSNSNRMKIAQEKDACNGLILKPNQIGTITETLTAANLAKAFGWKIMVSNRAGETEDDFIADLAAGINADFIKSGAPEPKERMAKYNRLIKIEKELQR